MRISLTKFPFDAIATSQQLAFSVDKEILFSYSVSPVPELTRKIFSPDPILWRDANVR